jgi:hypothetical protein
MLKVIGSGLGRTGTHSLKLALERLLGAPCYHMIEVFSRPPHFGLWTKAARGEGNDFHALFDGFSAAVDWPAAAFWKEISEAFPDAIILHSERSSPEAWFKSAIETIFKERPTPPPPPMAEMLASMFSRFTPNVRDKDAAIAAYNRHNANVRATAPASRLLLWKPGDGWEPICKALKLPVPSEPFPHSNTTEEFNARIAAGFRPGQPFPH